MCTPMNENWSNFLNKLSERLNKMLDYVEKNNSTLYETDIDKDVLWEVYLSSFPEGTNKMYRNDENMTVVIAETLLKQSVELWQLLTARFIQSGRSTQMM